MLVVLWLGLALAPGKLAGCLSDKNPRSDCGVSKHMPIAHRGKLSLWVSPEASIFVDIIDVLGSCGIASRSASHNP